MTRTPATRQRYAGLPLLVLTLAVLLIVSGTGCLHGPDRDEKQIPREERYIDAMLGFSVIHPLTWERIKTPVAVPEFSDRSISWRIPAENSPGTMLVRVYPAPAGPDALQKLLAQILEGKTVSAGAEIAAYQHAVGAALTTTIHDQQSSERLFAIKGTHNAYLLSFSAAPELLEKKSALFERIAESLRELQQAPPRERLDRQ